MAQTSGLLTATQVGELADVARQTVTRWVADGKLAAVRLPSGRLRFRREDVERLLTPTIKHDGSAA